MNKLRNKILTWGTVILLFAGVGCEDQDTAFPSQEEGRGRDASLTLAIGENLSRAAKDGDSMKKLVVLLVEVNTRSTSLLTLRGIWTCRQRHTRLEPRCPAR